MIQIVSGLIVAMVTAPESIVQDGVTIPRTQIIGIRAICNTVSPLGIRAPRVHVVIGFGTLAAIVAKKTRLV